MPVDTSRQLTDALQSVLARVRPNNYAAPPIACSNAIDQLDRLWRDLVNGRVTVVELPK